MKQYLSFFLLPSTCISKSYLEEVIAYIDRVSRDKLPKRSEKTFSQPPNYNIRSEDHNTRSEKSFSPNHNMDANPIPIPDDLDQLKHPDEYSSYLIKCTLQHISGSKTNQASVDSFLTSGLPAFAQKIIKGGDLSCDGAAPEQEAGPSSDNSEKTEELIPLHEAAMMLMEKMTAMSSTCLLLIIIIKFIETIHKTNTNLQKYLCMKLYTYNLYIAPSPSAAHWLIRQNANHSITASIKLLGLPPSVKGEVYCFPSRQLISFILLICHLKGL